MRESPGQLATQDLVWGSGRRTRDVQLNESSQFKLPTRAEISIK